MKNGLRIALLIAMLLALPGLSLRAQNEAAGAAVTYYQTAVGGTLTASGDHSYTLELSDAAPNTVLLSSKPLTVLQIATAEFAKVWAAGGANTAAKAVLELDSMTIQATLSQPTSGEDGSLSYQMTVDQILPVGKSATEAPEKFGTANLLIGQDAALATALAAGIKTEPADLTSGGQGNLTTGGQGNLTTGGSANLTTGGSLSPWTETLGSPDTAPGSAGVIYYQTAASGAFTANSDGSYSLELADVYPISMSASNAPLGVLWVSTEQFAKTWAAGSAKVAIQATLELDNMHITVALSQPVSDASAHTLTYRAVIKDIAPLVKGDAKPTAPDKFGAADLLISGDAALSSALTLGLGKAPIDLTSGGSGNLTTGGSGNLTTGSNDAPECQSAQQALADALTKAAASGQPLTTDQNAQLEPLNADAAKACPESSVLFTPAWRRNPAASAGNAEMPAPPRRSANKS